MSFQPCVCVCFLLAVCVWTFVCVCVCTRTHARDFVCMRFFAMFCMKMLIFVCFVRLYTTDFYNYGYLCIVCFSLSCKRLRFWKRSISSLLVLLLLFWFTAVFNPWENVPNVFSLLFHEINYKSEISESTSDIHRLLYVQLKWKMSNEVTHILLRSFVYFWLTGSSHVSF